MRLSRASFFVCMIWARGVLAAAALGVFAGTVAPNDGSNEPRHNGCADQIDDYLLKIHRAKIGFLFQYLISILNSTF